jgi:hypothetical protein
MFFSAFSLKHTSSFVLPLRRSLEKPHSDRSSRITSDAHLLAGDDGNSFHLILFRCRLSWKVRRAAGRTLFQGETKFLSLNRLNLIAINLLRFIRITHWNNALYVAEALKIIVDRLQLSISVTSSYTELKCEVNYHLNSVSLSFSIVWDCGDACPIFTLEQAVCGNYTAVKILVTCEI